MGESAAQCLVDLPHKSREYCWGHRKCWPTRSSTIYWLIPELERNPPMHDEFALGPGPMASRRNDLIFPAQM